VVTALEMRLHQVRELDAGDLFFPIQRAAEVLHAWREWTATVPDDVTSIGHLLRLPPLPRSPNRCAAGPSPSSRLPASATRAPAPS
jgi:hypothetical protein